MFWLRITRSTRSSERKRFSVCEPVFNASVWTSIPYIVGGGTEHMVKIVAPRGGENHQILDAPEGVGAEESTIAKQLGVITSQVAENKEQEGYLSTAARLRVAARIFGA